MEYTDLWTTSAGKQIHSIRCGSGKQPLHFLHANGLCAGTYLPLFEHLKNDFTVQATDIPGHGDSDFHGYKKIEHWKIFVDDVKESIIKHNTIPVVGVGHSLGAVVTLLTAARYPHLFSHIVLIDPVIFAKVPLFLFSIAKRTGLMKLNPLATGARRRKTEFTSRDIAFQRFSSGRGMFRTWSEDFIKSYCNHGLSVRNGGTAVLKCNPETEAQIYESILLDIWNYPPKVTCPTLVIRGGKSDTFYPGAANRLVKVMKKSKLTTFPGVSHFVPMEKPGECFKEILDFCK